MSDLPEGWEKVNDELCVQWTPTYVAEVVIELRPHTRAKDGRAAVVSDSQKLWRAAIPGTYSNSEIGFDDPATAIAFYMLHRQVV